MRGAAPQESAQRQGPSVLEAAHWYDSVATEQNLSVLSAPQLAALQTSHLRILQVRGGRGRALTLTLTLTLALEP